MILKPRAEVHQLGRLLDYGENFTYRYFHENGSFSVLHSFDERYLSHSTQVAEGTIFRKHKVVNLGGYIF